MIFKDETQEHLLGFFTLAIKDLDISKLEIKEKKKLVFNGKSPSKVGVAPSYLKSLITYSHLSTFPNTRSLLDPYDYFSLHGNYL